MVEKRVKKFGQGSPPPPISGNAQKKTFFFQEGFPNFPNVFAQISKVSFSIQLMGSSYKFDLTLSEDGSGGAHIALFEANAGAKISEIMEKI